MPCVRAFFAVAARGGYLAIWCLAAAVILLPGTCPAQPAGEAALPPETAAPPPETPTAPRNPFSLPKGVYLSSLAPVKKEPPPVEEFGFVLQAIVIGDKGKVATINNQNVREGDLIFDKKILEIKKNQVILRDEKKNEDITLTLGSIPFPIRVRKGF
ncbi:MAG: hypothetical protein ACE5G9_08985 [Nitrospinales bacterium]